jgi:ribonucleoside-diphosphate reductase alpha chain
MANDQTPVSRFLAPISESIWDMKYRLKEPDGTPVDRTVEDTWRRVAKALASVEADPATWEPRFTRLSKGSASCPPGESWQGRGRRGTSRCSTASSWGPSPTAWAASSSR